MANQYICINDLIKELTFYQDQYGNLPILVSAEGSDIDFLKPLREVFGINMIEESTGETQLAVVLTNYYIEDFDDSDNLEELEIEV